MNIGVYVKSLDPRGISHETFQGTILRALANLEWPHRIYVFSHTADPAVHLPGNLEHVLIRHHQAWKRLFHAFLRRGSRIIPTFGRFLGWQGWQDFLLRLERRWDPAYYEDIKKHEIRIMWYLNGDRLRVRIPFILTIWDLNALVHPMFPEWVDVPYGWDTYPVRAAYIICGTEVGARQIAHQCAVTPERIRVIPFPTPEFARVRKHRDPLPAAADFEPYLFYPARFWPHKNHVTVIRALALLRQRGLTLNLVLTGRDDGNQAYVMEVARSLGVAEQIRYLGVLTLDQLAQVYQHSSCLVYASLFGPDNLPPLEAFGLAVPVITSDIPGAREQYGDACLYFEPTSEEDLAARIHELHARPDLRHSLIERGRVRAEMWTGDHYACRFAGIIEEFERLARTWQYCDSVF